MQAQLTIALAAAALAWPAHARAPSGTGTATAAPSGTATAAATLDTIEVIDRRVEEPFDPHASRALTGRRLAELGATNLAEALEHIPAAFVRTAGRGGYQVDVRGARKGALLVLIDGMPISDPFFGNFDISSIPTTDIAEIRISNAPASPIDGPGGNGGVLEIITRSAAGRARAFAQASGGTAPGARAAVSAKGELGEGFAVRVSGSGSLDARTFTIDPANAPAGTVAQSGRKANAALLLEHIGEKSRVGVDIAAGHQRYLVPPSEEDGADLLVVDGEPTLRASVLGEYRATEALRLSLRGFAHSLSRDSLAYRDGNLAAEGALSRVEATRYGAFARADWQALEDVSLLASAAWISERGRETGTSGVGADGEVSVLQASAGARWAPRAWLSVDGAGGAAIPLSGGAAPWLEGRLAVDLISGPARLTLIGARKGRVPTLRERFQPSTGNAALAPEHSSYAEATLALTPLDFAALTTSGWVRDIEGVIKIPLGGNQLANAGDLLTGGLDVAVDVWLFERALELRAVYQLQSQSGDNPYDFFPTHRGEVSASARWGQLGAWARGRYLGDRIDQGRALGDVAMLDAGAWVRLETVRVIGRVENLFDATWLAHVGVPGFGRALWLGVEVATP